MYVKERRTQLVFRTCHKIKTKCSLWKFRTFRILKYPRQTLSPTKRITTFQNHHRHDLQHLHHLVRFVHLSSQTLRHRSHTLTLSHHKPPPQPCLATRVELRLSRRSLLVSPPSSVHTTGHLLTFLPRLLSLKGDHCAGIQHRL